MSIFRTAGWKESIQMRKLRNSQIFKASFLERAGSEKAQQNYQKMIEWYGSKDKAMDEVKDNLPEEVFNAYEKRSETLYKKLAELKG